MDLGQFRDTYDLREPAQHAENPRQEIALGDGDGLRLLETAPASGCVVGFPPRSNDDEESRNRYIWVIDERGIPHILEVPVPSLEGELPKHSNLAAGMLACVGGELWFRSATDVYVSGGSGRYPPRSEAELEDVVRVFESFAYAVQSLGWDNETGYAKRVLS